MTLGTMSETDLKIIKAYQEAKALYDALREKYKGELPDEDGATIEIGEGYVARKIWIKEFTTKPRQGGGYYQTKIMKEGEDTTFMRKMQEGDYA